MGCVLFELATDGKKALADDFNVHEHYVSPEPIDVTTSTHRSGHVFGSSFE